MVALMFASRSHAADAGGAPESALKLTSNPTRCVVTALHRRLHIDCARVVTKGRRQHWHERSSVVVPAGAGLLGGLEERPRCNAGKAHTLAREVRLVCVAGARSTQGEIVFRNNWGLRHRLL